jgi:hypothetical protein
MDFHFGSRRGSRGAFVREIQASVWQRFARSGPGVVAAGAVWANGSVPGVVRNSRRFMVISRTEEQPTL